MPIYMDVHVVPGVKAKDVAGAHEMDIFHQAEYGCKCMTYWIDEQRESIFCLIEAPDKTAVEQLHNKAHGMVPHKVIEVSADVVESFLGRIYDPANAETTDDGLKIFNDPSFRVLLVTNILDPVLLRHGLGKEVASRLLAGINELTRKYVGTYCGKEVEHAGDGFIVSFDSAVKAVTAALEIQKNISTDDAKKSNFKISLNAGEPVQKSSKLFGDTIQFAKNLSAISTTSKISIARNVKELIAKDHFDDQKQSFFFLSPQDEDFLVAFFNTLESNWQNAEFNVAESCQAMTMSQSQLYRKVVDLFDSPPNNILKDFRLQKAKELLRKKKYTVSQIAFDAGFASPSYFTKCFKEKYGLLPMVYVDLLSQ